MIWREVVIVSLRMDNRMDNQMAGALLMHLLLSQTYPNLRESRAP